LTVRKKKVFFHDQKATIQIDLKFNKNKIFIKKLNHYEIIFIHSLI